MVQRVFLVLLGLLSIASFPSSAEPWIDMDQDNGIVYFLFASPARVERFDLTTGAFLSSGSLPGTPSAMTIDSSGLYISDGVSVQRHNLDGSGGVHRLDVPGTIESLILLGSHLIVHYDGGLFRTYDKDTGAFLGGTGVFNMTGLSVNTTTRRIFGRTTSILPPSIEALYVNLDGTITDWELQDYNQDAATTTFTDASSTFVLDNSGTAYESADPNLQVAGSVAEPIEYAAFIPGGVVVVRGNHFVAYDTNLLETGQYTPAADPAAVAVNGNTVYGFRSIVSAPGVAATTNDLDEFAPVPATIPVSGTGLNYTADVIESDGSGLIYLLASDLRMIFVWSTSEQAYIDTIPLRDSPQYMAYSVTNDTIYLGYDTGKIMQVDLSTPYDEVPFANDPLNIIGIKAVDSFVFTAAPSTISSIRSFHMYDATGTLTDSTSNSAEISLEYVWEPNMRRLYYLQDNISPNDLNYMHVNIDGTFGLSDDSPYHGDFSFEYPIRISSDGQTITTGTGRVFDINLNNTDLLPESILDGAWFNGNLHTLHAAGAGSSRVQRWTGAGFSPGLSTVRFGTPRALFTVPEGLLLIHELNGTPRFTLFDANLQIIPGPNAPLDWNWLLVCFAPLCMWGVYRSVRSPLR